MEKINDSKKIANALQELLEKNCDAEQVYKDGLNDTEDNLLKDFILTQAKQRARFAKELERELYQIDHLPAASGTLQGTLQRTWMDLKTIFFITLPLLWSAPLAAKIELKLMTFNTIEFEFITSSF